MYKLFIHRSISLTKEHLYVTTFLHLAKFGCVNLTSMITHGILEFLIQIIIIGEGDIINYLDSHLKQTTTNGNFWKLILTDLPITKKSYIDLCAEYFKQSPCTHHTECDWWNKLNKQMVFWVQIKLFWKRSTVSSFYLLFS